MLWNLLRRDRGRLRPLILAILFCPLFATADAPGGFIEQTSADARSLLSDTEILSLLPERGLFTFPAPYNTEAIRLTNASDCGGADCVNPVGYSYWRNINNHVGQDSMLILLSLDKSRGGQGPTLFEYNKVNDELRNLGPLFDSNSSYSWGHAQGWYFSATMPTKLYINGSKEMLRYDVISGEFDSVLDITTELGNDRILWQMHSSDDDRVHSATVRDSDSYEMLGCMAYEEDADRFHYFPKTGAFDECQIDGSGRWLIIKENVDGIDGEDNRIIDLQNGTERVLLDAEGAGGHSDVGHGYMVAADNWAGEANTQKLWHFADDPLSGTVAYSNETWGVQAPAHISHTNARDDVPAEQQYACGSSANRDDALHANEIICFQLDSSGDVLVVAPVMTDLDADSKSDYRSSPKGNLDVTGQYFIWTSNMGGERLDAFLVKVPEQLLTDPDGSDGTSTDTGTLEISNINEPLLIATEATITWDTSEAADTQIEYGTSSDYGLSSTLDPGLSTSHSQSLLSLSPGTSYHYRVKSRNEAGELAVSGDRTFTTPSLLDDSSGDDTTGSGDSTDDSTTDDSTTDGSTDETSGDAPVAEPVNWTRQINVSSDGGSLTKTSGCDGCSDAGAISGEQVITGEGYLEFTADTQSELLYIGLSNQPDSTTGPDIDFALRLQDNIVEVREDGVYQGDAPFSAGDTFRISVQDGQVSYSRNGDLGYTSSVTPASELRAHAAFYSLEASIDNAVVSEGSSLLGHWRFEETDSDIARDDSQYGFDGSLVNGPVRSSNEAGTALSFDGVDDHVNVAHHEAFNTYPLSISLWVKTDATGLHGLVNRYAAGAMNGYQVFVNDGQLCAWYFRDADNHTWDGSACTLGTDGVTDNQWHHVVFSVDEQGGKLYVDGELSASEAWTGTPGASSTSQPLKLASYPGTDEPYLSGSLDDVRIHARSLDQSDARELYQSLSRPQPVNWTDRVNVSIDNSRLSKTSGCDGCDDAGAASGQQITEGDGYLEFTVDTGEGLQFVGLSGETSGTEASTIDFALRFQSGYAEVRENGSYQTDTGFATGDVFRIAVKDGTVTYTRNGDVFHTSSATPAYPLRADTSFYSMDTSISEAMLMQ